MAGTDWTLVTAVAFLALMIVGAWIVVASTRMQGKWGVNLKPPRACPCCGERLPFVRVPDSLGQLLFGGWTCRSCGAGVDKWGEVAKRSGR